MDRPHSPYAIVVENLVKRYGERTAVDGLSFRVRRGDIFALLGPNGAGKTTTVEILEGLRTADGGTVRVLGLDPAVDGSLLKPRIGAMPQEGGLYPAITPREALHLFSHFYPRPADPDKLLARVGLGDAAKTRYRRLSGGQKQRLSLALALVGQPELVFLDEPTAGLDPQARRTAWNLIANLQSTGVTVVLTTHYLEEAEQLANRVAIIEHGVLITQGSPQALVRGDGSVVRLRTARSTPIEVLERLPAAQAVREDGPGNYVIDTMDAAALLIQLTIHLRDANIPIVELRVGQGSLEEVYLRLTGEVRP